MEPVDAAEAAQGALWVDVPGYSGPLDRLVSAAQRGELDLSALPVSAVTEQFRQRMSRPQPPTLDEVADFLALAARLVALKAAALLPESSAAGDGEADEGAEDDAGRRLAEYRLFRAAVDSLLAGADDGYRSFLGLVAPEVVPVERLRVAPERLVAALRAVVERLSPDEPLPLGSVTFSVREMVARLRARLAGGGVVAFEALFTDVTSRLEAVACFLALLEMLNGNEATVHQDHPFGPILIRLGG